MLEFIDRVLDLNSTAPAWFLAQSLTLQVLARAVAPAVLRALWIILRLTLIACRAAFRGP